MAKARKSSARGGPPKGAVALMTRALAARQKADEAMEKAHLKVFAAKMIVHIAREAGIAPPPMAVRKAVMERGKAKAAAAKAHAQSTAAAFRKKVAQRVGAGLLDGT